MSATTCLYDQLLPLLRQYSRPRDLRHLKALAWMVTALVCSSQLSLSVVCCGRAVPLLWRVLEHPSATVTASKYIPLLRLAHHLLKPYPNVMLLADRGFANHAMMS